MKRCLLCAEEVQELAVWCPHCGGDLVPSVVRSLARRWPSLNEKAKAHQWSLLSAESQEQFRAYRRALEEIGGWTEPRHSASWPVKVAMLAALLGSALGGLLLFGYLDQHQDAPTLAASLPIAVAVVPYCFARALQELFGPRG